MQQTWEIESVPKDGGCRRSDAHNHTHLLSKRRQTCSRILPQWWWPVSLAFFAGWIYDNLTCNVVFVRHSHETPAGTLSKWLLLAWHLLPSHHELMAMLYCDECRWVQVSLTNFSSNLPMLFVWLTIESVSFADSDSFDSNTDPSLVTLSTAILLWSFEKDFFAQSFVQLQDIAVSR